MNKKLRDPRSLRSGSESSVASTPPMGRGRCDLSTGAAWAKEGGSLRFGITFEAAARV